MHCTFALIVWVMNICKLIRLDPTFVSCYELLWAVASGLVLMPLSSFYTPLSKKYLHFLLQCTGYHLALAELIPPPYRRYISEPWHSNWIRASDPCSMSYTRFGWLDSTNIASGYVADWQEYVVVGWQYSTGSQRFLPMCVCLIRILLAEKSYHDRECTISELLLSQTHSERVK